MIKKRCIDDMCLFSRLSSVYQFGTINFTSKTVIEDPRKDYFFPIYSLIGFFYPMIRFKLASVLLNKDLAAIKVFM